MLPSRYGSLVCSSLTRVGEIVQTIHNGDADITAVEDHSVLCAPVCD